jgi:SNF2 family DNA or RNA helicase
LQKSGTGADLIELKRRKSLVKLKMDKMKKENDTALMQGKIPSHDLTKLVVDNDLHVSEWSPVLVVVPNTVVQNWVDAFQTWGHFAVAVYQGTTSRESQLHSVSIGINEILICPKSMFERREHFDKFLLISWKIVVIDEFHQFKNETSHLAVNLRSLRDKLGCKVIGLTGTLMQNDHKELWTLIDLISKNFLQSWGEFKKEFAQPIKLSRYGWLSI